MCFICLEYRDENKLFQHPVEGFVSCFLRLLNFDSEGFRFNFVKSDLSTITSWDAILILPFSFHHYIPYKNGPLYTCPKINEPEFVMSGRDSITFLRMTILWCAYLRGKKNSTGYLRSLYFFSFHLIFSSR